MKLPSDLYYTKEHEWLRLSEDGTTAKIGITDFAQGELGDIVFVELEPEGSELDKDDVFGTVEAVKTVSDLFMPVAGTIIALNAELEDNPEAVNDAPYDGGWMIEVALSNPEEVQNLMSAGDYEAMVG
jgi:glycine cleavage system H protein